MTLTPLQTRTEYVVQAQVVPDLWFDVRLPHDSVDEAKKYVELLGDTRYKTRIIQRVRQESLVVD